MMDDLIHNKTRWKLCCQTLMWWKPNFFYAIHCLKIYLKKSHFSTMRAKRAIFSSLFTFIRITPVYYLRILGPSQHRKLRKVLKWDLLIRFLTTVYVPNKYSLMDVTSALKVSYFLICHCTCVATSRREQKRATSVWEESTTRKKATALNEMVMTRRFSQSQVIRRKVKRLRFKWMLPLPSR